MKSNWKKNAPKVSDGYLIIVVSVFVAQWQVMAAKVVLLQLVSGFIMTVCCTYVFKPVNFFIR
jgi:hypothetical protein